MQYKYSFIPAENISDRIIELSELEHNKIYDLFISCEYEVIYITDQGKIYGIITPGDLYRYYLSGKTVQLVNPKFSSIDEADFEKADAVFRRIASIHEVPVVRDNTLLGIVTDPSVRKPEAEWRGIKESFEQFTPERVRWTKDLVKRFLNAFPGLKIYVYISPRYKLSYVLPKCIESTWSDDDYKKLKAKSFKRSFGKMTTDEHRGFFKELYYDGVVEQYSADRSELKLVTHNGISSFVDISNSYFNIRNGHRVVNNAPDDYEKRIMFFGPCLWFGSYSSDDHTIEYYLQESINADNLCRCRVENHSCLSFTAFDHLMSQCISPNDIIVLMAHLNDECEAWIENAEEFPNIIIKDDLVAAYNVEDPISNLFDDVMHCNHIINKRIADIIYEDLKNELSSDADSQPRFEPKAFQKHYISWDVVSFYRDYFRKHGIARLENGEKKGAIVMNCNPFTRGHRYLIEQASEAVDRLYIFVVEEDRSVFKFNDRFNMVRAGTQDLANVIVIPSGKYIISKETFSQYFEKDDVTEIESMDYDIHIFAEVIAKELDISCRFAGEEPFDKVTREYNETMKRILPASGVEFIEIPRVKTADQQIISASAVRRLINEKKYDMLSAFLPDTTIRYLEDH